MTDIDLLTVLAFACAVGFFWPVIVDEAVDAVIDCLCWIVRRWSE